MTDSIVTCKSVGVYEHALTRGKQYQVTEYSEEKYGIMGNHGKHVWISKGHFISGNISIPSMINWKFDKSN